MVVRMKHLAPIPAPGDERKCAALASHSLHRKSVCLGMFRGCQTALVLRFEMHHPGGFEDNRAHRRYARERRPVSGPTTPRYGSFQRFEPPVHRAPFVAVLVTISRQRDAASQPCRNMDLPIRAQSFALEAVHFSERFLHRPPHILHCIGGELGSRVRWRSMCRVCSLTVRRHSKYVPRKQGKIKGAARRALKALSAHVFSHLIPKNLDALLEIAC